MELTEEQTSKCLILTIKGRLDTVNYNLLEAKLAGIIDRREYNILLDCSGLEYISSSGLRILLMGLKKVSHLHGRFVLAALQPNIAEVFRISGFVSIFDIYSTKEEALKSY
jgi:anti-sigma B factor antagonist